MYRWFSLGSKLAYQHCVYHPATWDPAWVAVSEDAEVGRMIDIICSVAHHHDHPPRHHLVFHERTKETSWPANRAKTSEPQFTSMALGFDYQWQRSSHTAPSCTGNI